MTTPGCCCGRTSHGHGPGPVRPEAVGGTREPGAAVRAKRQSTAVVAAVVSVAVGTLFLRFLRARGDALRYDEIGKSGVVGQHCPVVGEGNRLTRLLRARPAPSA